MKHWSRREFLRFMGKTAGATAVALPVISCSGPGSASGIAGIAPGTDDEVVLADGLQYELLVSWGDPINGRGDRFGFNNDYTAFFPIDGNPHDGLLWVNHEEVLSAYFSSPRDPAEKSRQDIEREMTEVGGSIIRIRMSDGHWRLVPDDRYNRRIDATTPIPISSREPVAGTREAIGTLGNCAGGITPWRTVLTCEENFHFFYGDVRFENGRRVHDKDTLIGWDRYLDYPPEHYGWVVEIDPFTGAANKLTTLGRFAHEGATVTLAHDGRPVVYMGDDKTDEHIYKFVADEPGSLDPGRPVRGRHGPGPLAAPVTGQGQTSEGRVQDTDGTAYPHPRGGEAGRRHAPGPPRRYRDRPANRRRADRPDQAPATPVWFPS